MNSIDSAEESQIHSYHCICTTLVLTTPYLLQNLPKRSAASQDQASILPIASEPDSDSSGSQSLLSNVVPDRKAVIVRREDGFEKRRLLRCARCKLVFGYNVIEGTADKSNAQVVYLLPGGLLSTEDMKAGKIPEVPSWGEETA